MKKIILISDFKPRIYQQTIFANSIDKNSLVVLPTGLGKTVIAILLSVYYFNKSNKKILFLAPTKPLVEQQEKSFKNFFSNSDDFNFCVLTGLISPKKRVLMYEENDFVFSTPQLIENDIVNRIINPKDFALVVVDEAHRTTGNYAYTFIAEQFFLAGCKILALTASPGTDEESIKEIMTNLRIETVQVKKYTDSDVKPYVNKTDVEKVIISLPETFKKIKNLLNKVYDKRIGMVKEYGYFEGKITSQISKKDLLDLQGFLRAEVTGGSADEKVWKCISISAGLMKLQYGIELFESQEVSAAHTYFYNFFRDGGDKSKAAEDLIRDVDFREAYEMISKLKKEGVEHPKLTKLKEIVNQRVYGNSDLKIIIFNQYRETASKIVEELSKIKEIKPALFVGQAKKGDVKLSQKDQKKILDDFREGNYNVIVSTSVGEEGLDIPKVDLVIFYEPVPSAIRTIQRIGRTGRLSRGEALILITDGTRDVVTSHISSAKEKKMHRILDKLKDDFSGFGNGEKTEDLVKSKNTLNKFLVNENENQSLVEGDDTHNSNNKGEDGFGSSSDLKFDSRKLIYIDNRENNDLIKELFNSTQIRVETKQLLVGDIVITDHIAIERKAKIDFVNSIIDKRLFGQLIELAKNYKRPLLILEGSENIFTLRNINPNVIRATISAIAVDLRIPIIYTDSILETKAMVETIVRRAYTEKKDISLAENKSSISDFEELEKLVSTIPKINVVTAKNLLNKFGSIENLVNASLDDLNTTVGIGKIRAKFLYDFFRREYK